MPLSSEQNLLVTHRKLERLERLRHAHRMEAMQKSKLCDHIVGESYLSGARNIERRVFHLSEARKQFKGRCSEVYLKEFFRYIFKFCPLCGKKIRNISKLIAP